MKHKSKLVEKLTEARTLSAWLDSSPVQGGFKDNPNGKGQCYWLPDSVPDELRRELWNLADWRVSSVVGGAIWLMPMKKFEPFR